MIVREEFAEVPAVLIDSQKVKLAGLVCSLVSRELGLGAVKVRWLMPAYKAGYAAPKEMRYMAEDDFAGVVRSNWPGTIFLRADNSLRTIAEITAHECRHLWQAQQYGDWRKWWKECSGKAACAAQEEDAEAYAQRFTRALGW